MQICNYLDLFSQTPTLKINGKEKLTSIFGSIVGFLSLCITIIGLVYFSHDYFAKLTFSVNFFIDTGVSPKIDLKKFKLAILITDLMGNELPDKERIFSLNALYWDIFLPGPNDNNPQSLIPTEIPKIKCFEYKNDSLFKNETDFLGKKFKTDCFDFESLNKSLYGNNNNFGEYSVFDVFLQRCVNSTFKNDCLPKEIIDEKLSNFFLIISYIDNDIKLDDPNDPFKPFLKHETFPLSNSVYKILKTKIADIRIKTDQNLIFNEYKETKNYKFQQFTESIDFRKDHSLFKGAFSHLTFETTGNTHKYTVIYKKILNVITDLGGFYNGIKFAATFVVYFYSNNIILWKYISSLISTEEIEENINKPIMKIDVVKIEPVSNLDGSNQNQIQNKINKHRSLQHNNNNNHVNDNSIDQIQNKLNKNRSLQYNNNNNNNNNSLYQIQNQNKLNLNNNRSLKNNNNNNNNNSNSNSNDHLNLSNQENNSQMKILKSNENDQIRLNQKMEIKNRKSIGSNQRNWE